jgi:Glyoxalase-like domain
VILGIGNFILGVADLTVAAERLRGEGLDVQEGGTHPAFGTRNLIVPLGPSYLELLAVDDQPRAETSEFGRSLLARIAGGDRLTRWSMRTDRIDEVAAELGIEVEDRSRERPDGRVLRWRSAGITESLRDPSRPFFMQWPDEDWPGGGAARLSWLEVSILDRAALTHWTLGADLPLRVTDGPPDLVAVGLDVAGHEVRVPSGD